MKEFESQGIRNERTPKGDGKIHTSSYPFTKSYINKK